MRKMIVFTLVLAACATNTTDYKAKVQDASYIHRSIKQVTDVIVYDIFSPPVASRIYAYASTAGYEVIRHQDPNYLTLAGLVHGLTPVPEPEAGVEYCYPLASVEAILKVGKALVFSDDKMDEFHSGIMKEFKDLGVPDDIFERSVDYGDKVADHILKWSSTDNYKETRSFPKYTILDEPDTWKPTPPAYMDAIEPHWNKIRTFVIDSAQQFKPTPPTDFSIEKGSAFFAEAKEVRDVGAGLTPEQREIASFWDCNPFMMNVKGHVMFATKKISPGGHWMNITREVCQNENADPVRSLEAYSHVALSLADGFISSWDEKYRSKRIRPETYINQYIDENWTPLLQTPPFPEYTSAHSVISSSAATQLTELFGDNYAFTDSTEAEFGMPPRSFKSFYDASKEAAISRMYGGIHYKQACMVGVDEGRAVGRFIADRIKTRKETSK